MSIATVEHESDEADNTEANPHILTLAVTKQDYLIDIDDSQPKTPADATHTASATPTILPSQQISLATTAIINDSDTGHDAADFQPITSTAATLTAASASATPPITPLQQISLPTAQIQDEEPSGCFRCFRRKK